MKQLKISGVVMKQLKKCDIFFFHKLLHYNMSIFFMHSHFLTNLCGDGARIWNAKGMGNLWLIEMTDCEQEFRTWILYSMQTHGVLALFCTSLCPMEFDFFLPGSRQINSRCRGAFLEDAVARVPGRQENPRYSKTVQYMKLCFPFWRAMPALSNGYIFVKHDP